MAATPSSMLPLGTAMPHFSLPDAVSESLYEMPRSPASRGTVIAFICNHCPYVKHMIDSLVDFANEYRDRGIQVLAISSNDVERYPEDSSDMMALLAQKHFFGFPYLYDETQEIAKAFQAECTPDFYLFNEKSILVYRGRFDNSTPGNGEPVTGSDLRKAVESLLKGNAISGEQYPSIGCSIKWKLH